MKQSVIFFSIVATAFAQKPPDLSGVWVVNSGLEITADPPYKADALKLWQEHKANLAKVDPAQFCLPNGAVRMTNLPYKIVQTPKMVVLLSEGNTHSYRRFLDGRPHNLDLDPNSWTGDSIAHWDAETLVVDTVGFNDNTWLDDTGKPHSDELHVIEHYRRVDAGHLEIQYTLEDPKALTKPFTFTRVLVPAGRELQEKFCTDTNRLAVK